MIENVTNQICSATQPPTRAAGPPGDQARGHPVGANAAPDALDLSAAAQERMEQAAAQPLRLNLIERIRAEIAAGDYLTNERIEAAVNKLHAELFSAA